MVKRKNDYIINTQNQNLQNQPPFPKLHLKTQRNLQTQQFFQGKHPFPNKGNHLKKLLYTTLNQRKDQLNSLLEDNKMMEQHLKQIQKEKDVLKKNIKLLRSSDVLKAEKVYENPQLKLLF